MGLIHFRLLPVNEGGVAGIPVRLGFVSIRIAGGIELTADEETSHVSVWNLVPCSGQHYLPDPGQR